MKRYDSHRREDALAWPLREGIAIFPREGGVLQPRSLYEFLISGDLIRELYRANRDCNGTSRKKNLAQISEMGMIKIKTDLIFDESSFCSCEF